MGRQRSERRHPRLPLPQHALCAGRCANLLPVATPFTFTEHFLGTSLYDCAKFGKFGEHPLREGADTRGTILRGLALSFRVLSSYGVGRKCICVVLCHEIQWVLLIRHGLLLFLEPQSIIGDLHQSLTVHFLCGGVQVQRALQCQTSPPLRGTR